MGDLLETYERVIGKSAFLRSTGSQILILDSALVNVNLCYEVQKQSYIKSLVKKPIASKKTKPSKKTSNTVFKQSLILAQASNDSRNLSANKESSQYLSAVYFQKGPQKVSTPKGLPSEIRTMSNFLSEDDSKSTNSKDQKNSVEETKSETSSIKSFFKSTLEKIQNKLRNNKVEESKKEQNVEAKSLMIDCAKFKGFSLSGLVQSQRYNDVLLKSSDSFKFHNKSIFSPVFGQPSEFIYGRPKCYSETASLKVKGIMSSGNPGPGNLLTQIRAMDHRASNKSYHESPKSFGQAFETFDDPKLKSDLLS